MDPAYYLFLRQWLFPAGYRQGISHPENTAKRSKTRRCLLLIAFIFHPLEQRLIVSGGMTNIVASLGIRLETVRAILIGHLHAAAFRIGYADVYFGRRRLTANQDHREDRE